MAPELRVRITGEDARFTFRPRILSPDFHRLDCQHYGLREHEHDDEDENDLVAASPRCDHCRPALFPTCLRCRRGLVTDHELPNCRPMSDAEEITKKSQSNLAFAFVSLPKEKRRDITTFYAFCRQIDDAADDPNVPLVERRRWLEGWRSWLREEEAGEPAFASELRKVIERYHIDLRLFEEILLGVESDLEPVNYPNFEALHRYCYRVASAVGLVSIEIFGYQNPMCKEYAHILGVALQLTNIIRDVGKDLQNDRRIYLPLAELNMFGYSEERLRRRIYDRNFVRLMEFQAERAHSFFSQARRLLPPEDRRSMIAAEGMRAIYFKLLRRIEKDQFRVFEKMYRVSRLEKAMIISGQIASNLLR